MAADSNDDDTEGEPSGGDQPGSADGDPTAVPPAAPTNDTGTSGTEQAGNGESATGGSTDSANQSGGTTTAPGGDDLTALAEEPWEGLFEDGGGGPKTPDPANPPDPDYTPTDPQDEGSQRLPVPSQESQDQAKAAVRRIFHDDISAARTPAARVELAQKLFNYADQTRSDPAARYTLLTLSRDLAADAGEQLMIVQAVDALAEEYQVDRLKIKADAFEKAGRSAATPQVLGAVMEGTRSLVDDAVRQSRYDIAEDLAEMCLAGARRLRSRDLVAQCSALLNEVNAKKRRFDAAQRALETLKVDPEDAEANLSLGKYLVLTKRDWQQGLPHLARGSDERLADAANLELSKPADPHTKIAIAELWLKLSAANRGEESQQRYLRRAIRWYEKALPELESLEKIATAKKLEELGVAVNLAGSSQPGPKPKDPIPKDKPSDESGMSDADLLDAVADDPPTRKPPRPTPAEKDEPEKEPKPKPTKPSGETVEDFFGPRPPRPEEDKDEGDFFGQPG